MPVPATACGKFCCPTGGLTPLICQDQGTQARRVFGAVVRREKGGFPDSYLGTRQAQPYLLRRSECRKYCRKTWMRLQAFAIPEFWFALLPVNSTF